MVKRSIKITLIEFIGVVLLGIDILIGINKWVRTIKSARPFDYIFISILFIVIIVICIIIFKIFIKKEKGG